MLPMCHPASLHFRMGSGFWVTRLPRGVLSDVPHQPQSFLKSGRAPVTSRPSSDSSWGEKPLPSPLAQ
jgi:hypothetical protein